MSAFHPLRTLGFGELASQKINGSVLVRTRQERSRGRALAPSPTVTAASPSKVQTMGQRELCIGHQGLVRRPPSPSGWPRVHLTGQM
jgi:hypothetical protein